MRQCSYRSGVGRGAGFRRILILGTGHTEHSVHLDPHLAAVALLPVASVAARRFRSCTRHVPVQLQAAFVQHHHPHQHQRTQYPARSALLQARCRLLQSGISVEFEVLLHSAGYGADSGPANIRGAERQRRPPVGGTAQTDARNGIHIIPHAVRFRSGGARVHRHHHHRQVGGQRRAHQEFSALAERSCR